MGKWVPARSAPHMLGDHVADSLPLLAVSFLLIPLPPTQLGGFGEIIRHAKC